MGIHILLHPRKWNHKHIILVTLTGTLVVITMTAIISIILSPAHIDFSIENPTSSDNQTDTTHYNFTLVAQNKSPHMAVAYGGVSADIWYKETAWVPAVVNQSSLQDETTSQKPTKIEFSAEYWQSEQRNTPPTPKASSGGGGVQSEPSTDETDWSNCTVLVTATVWFKYSWISTRSYDVRANCSHVNFNTTGGGTVRCCPYVNFNTTGGGTVRCVDG